MVIDIEEERLIVISDLHLGNPFCFTKRHIVDFMGHVCDADYSLVINGDGMDIMQTSFLRVAKDVPEVFALFRRFAHKGLRVYYVVGNHDLVLEHFLENWGNFILAPFLNIRSGDLRIHVEHGHLYDPFFVHRPELYEFLTRAAGVALRVSPSLYRFYMRAERWWKRQMGEHDGIPGERPTFVTSARAILSRGFDTVILGHTHHPGVIELPGGQTYINTGAWLTGSFYARIEHGQVSLHEWDSKPFPARPEFQTPSTRRRFPQPRSAAQVAASVGAVDLSS